MKPTQSPAVATHTPTPWRVSSQGNVVDSRICRIATIEDMPGDEPQEKAANAAFIVRACNSHAQLVAALEKADTVARLANSLSCCRSIREATEAKLYSKLATALVEYCEARAALQSAKGN